jgi:PBP1b-binding outer membrane lipoprotein LpoB
MTRCKWTCTALVVALLLTGCAGFWDPPANPTPPTTKSSGFF